MIIDNLILDEGNFIQQMIGSHIRLLAGKRDNDLMKLCRDELHKLYITFKSDHDFMEWAKGNLEIIQQGYKRTIVFDGTALVEYSEKFSHEINGLNVKFTLG